ncbi:hypothetical protein Golomagni_07421, partial [Golovinomyces magnicellulatus]
SRTQDAHLSRPLRPPPPLAHQAADPRCFVVRQRRWLPQAGTPVNNFFYPESNVAASRHTPNCHRLHYSTMKHDPIEFSALCCGSQWLPTGYPHPNRRLAARQKDSTYAHIYEKKTTNSVTSYDDLYEEETEVMQIALKRLSAKESYDRVYRLRRSIQCSYQHKLLPKDQWTKPEEQDIPYLSPILAEVEAELAEKDALDTMTVIKSH